MTYPAPARCALGFTGTRHLRPVDLATVMDDTRGHLTDPAYTAFISGGCIGVDGLVGRYAADLRPDAAHLITVPWDLSQVDPWWKTRDYRVRELTDTRPRIDAHVLTPGIYVARMAPGTDYRDRNTALVRSSDRLRAYPVYARENPRSRRTGTWQTVRIAETFSVPVEVVVLRP